MEKFRIILTGLLLIINFLSLYSQADKEEVRLALTGEFTANLYSSLKPSVQLNVRSAIRNSGNLMNRYDENPIFPPVLIPSPDVETFALAGIKNWLEKIGFMINVSSTHPSLNIIVQQYEINYLSGNGWTGTVKMTFELTGSEQYELYSYTSLGFFKMPGNPKNFREAAEVINKAFYESLNKVDWSTVAGLSKQTGTEMASEIKTLQEEQATGTDTRQTEDFSVSGRSDIDTDIPVSSRESRNTFAVIIGNEDYVNEIQVKYAKNDARTFYEYVMKTLGVPSENIHYAENATYGKMLGEIGWINDIARVYNGEAKLIFYYAGHGVPDESSRSAYLLPVDGEASNIRTALRVEDIYAALSEYPVLQATVFLDACFSGGARDGTLMSGRGVKIAPEISQPPGKLVVFSAASGDETAHPYEDKQHGLFSYYLMKKLKETNGEVTFEELNKYLGTKVSQQSVVAGKEQNPTINAGSSVQATVGTLKLK